ncbi:Armadillo/beta-catenin-like repeat-containing protein [Handroanthus impetiginosus]|uniref:Armadillo/beta-catenin-like repeat-containing protein n=1 Tax=Handroanthus impetiginosus TaxID=429701 RepID=A0A2G9G8C6_9LAMI|nr:Armadillo/beta-catenin-like repeat-containing protein [Handroanthus impetiginosus]
MVPSISISTMVAALLVVLAMGVAHTEPVNKSASLGPFWSTAKEEGDLLTLKAEADNDFGGPTAHEDAEHNLDGGFSSLDGMLQWAIGHSDPAKLKEATLEIQRLSPEELEQRQMEIKELMEKLETPSDAKLMKIAIDDLNNSSLSLEDRHRALQELLILVEPIDNANDLHKVGGLKAVIRELNNPNPEIRTISAWILGKASQNNLFVQNQILELGTLAKLMQMARSDLTEEAKKALYAISALIRNNLEGQGLFYMEAGHLMLQNILSNSSTDIRLLRKSVFLLADLVECQLDSRNNAELPFFSSHVFLKSVVDLMASEDLDLQEKHEPHLCHKWCLQLIVKNTSAESYFRVFGNSSSYALYAVKNLLLLRTSDALVFKEVCKLDVAMGRMKQRLQQFILDDKFKEYALDVENLRREVELIFLGKLDKVKPVST